MRNYIITATGTNIGKTYITAAFAAQLQPNVKVLKPIITGWQSSNNDTEILLKAAGQEPTQDNINACSPWRFKAPLAADMAMHLEHRNIDFHDIVTFCQQPFSGTKLIEGAGGLMSPLNEEKTFIDLIYALKYPVILVTGTYLGSISHTLTALKALEGYQVQVIINESENSEVPTAKTAESISRFTKAPITILRRGETPQARILRHPAA